MSSTSDKLNKAIESKEAIKQALIDQGVDIDDTTTFAEYADKVRSIQGADLTGYVTDEELANALLEKADAIHIHNDYMNQNDVADMIVDSTNGLASEDWVNAQLAAIDLSPYATVASLSGKADIDIVPTRNSELENDTGYITEAEFNNYATKEFVINEIKNADVDLTGYATIEQLELKADKDDIPINVSAFNNDSGYLTQHQDISHLATTDAMIIALSNKSDKDHTHDFISEIPDEYITEAELAAKKYLTEHQDISHLANKSDIPSLVGYATEAYVNNQIDAIPKVDLTSYATIPLVDAKITMATSLLASEAYVDKEIADLIGGAPGTLDTLEKISEALADNDGALDALLEGLDNKADKVHNHDDMYYTESEIDELLANVEVDLTGYVTEDILNNKGYVVQQDIEPLDNRVQALEEIDMNNYYTKEESDYMDGNKRLIYLTFDEFQAIPDEDKLNEDVVFIITDLEDEFASRRYVHEVIDSAIGNHDHGDMYTTKEWVNEALANVSVDLEGYATESFVTEKIAEAHSTVIDLSGYATKDELSNKANIDAIPTNVSQLINDAGYLLEIPSEYITEAELEAKHYLTEHQDLSEYATKEDLANINIDGYATEEYVDTEINELIGGAPGTLQTLEAISNALTEDDNAINVLMSALVTKAEKEHTHSEYLTMTSMNVYATKTYVNNAMISNVTTADIDAFMNNITL